MVFDKIKGLSPAMKAKYWNEAIRREGGGGAVDPLNTGVILASNKKTQPNLPPPRKQFAPWKLLVDRHELAAGNPSPIVKLARKRGGAYYTRDYFAPSKDPTRDYRARKYDRPQRSASEPTLTPSSRSTLPTLTPSSNCHSRSTLYSSTSGHSHSGDQEAFHLPAIHVSPSKPHYWKPDGGSLMDQMERLRRPYVAPKLCPPLALPPDKGQGATRK